MVAERFGNILNIFVKKYIIPKMTMLA